MQAAASQSRKRSAYFASSFRVPLRGKTDLVVKKKKKQVQFKPTIISSASAPSPPNAQPMTGTIQVTLPLTHKEALEYKHAGWERLPIRSLPKLAYALDSRQWEPASYTEQRVCMLCLNTFLLSACYLLTNAICSAVHNQ